MAEETAGKQIFGNALFQKGNKFRVAPVEKRTAVDGTVLDSKLEKAFYEIIQRNLPDAEVRRQVSFVLQHPFRGTSDGKVVRGMHYRADFVFGPLGGTEDDPVPLPGCVIVDAKGMETPEFKMKAKMFTYRFRHQVCALKSQKQLLAAIEYYKKLTKMNELLKARAADKRPFHVRGYKRSDGSVVDLKVRFMEPDGYLNLARVSLGQMRAGDDKKQSAAAADTAAYAEGRAAVVAQLEKAVSARDTDENTTQRVSKETLEPVCDNLCLLNGHPTHVVAFRLEVLHEETVEEPTKVTKSRNAASEYKKRITANLPVSRYCHRLNLYEGNYREIV